MTAMLDRFAPDASEALRLAARCQHIQRWNIPRAGYPMTRTGYNEWRIRLRNLHADSASTILRESGYDEALIDRVCSLIKKKGIKVDPEAQALEDVVDLVFVESYLADFVATHSHYDEAKLLDILRKTSTKMSASGRAAALTLIKPPADLLPAIGKAMAP